jgi:imidazolonepropionase-like amidohydrolase
MAEALLIRDATLIDGTGAPPVERAEIAIGSDRITAIGPAGEVAEPEGAGLTNMEVLRGATARAAEALRRDDIGTIEAGKQADLLLLRRNPLDDLSALRDIHRVIHDGRVFDPA